MFSVQKEVKEVKRINGLQRSDPAREGIPFFARADRVLIEPLMIVLGLQELESVVSRSVWSAAVEKMGSPSELRVATALAVAVSSPLQSLGGGSKRSKNSSCDQRYSNKFNRSPRVGGGACFPSKKKSKSSSALLGGACFPSSLLQQVEVQVLIAIGFIRSSHVGSVVCFPLVSWQSKEYRYCRQSCSASIWVFARLVGDVISLSAGGQRLRGIKFYFSKFKFKFQVLTALFRSSRAGSVVCLSA